MFKEYLSPEAYARFMDIVTRGMVDANTTLKWCPAPGCKYVSAHGRRRRMRNRHRHRHRMSTPPPPIFPQDGGPVHRWRYRGRGV